MKSDTEPTSLRDAQAPRVLLVEDDEDNREMLAICLSRAGYALVEVGNGADALDALSEQRFDVAIMDIGLPDMSGVEAGQRARARHPELKLVAVTGFGTQADRERLRAAGFDAHVVKPVDIGALCTMLKTLTTDASSGSRNP